MPDDKPDFAGGTRLGTWTSGVTEDETGTLLEVWNDSKSANSVV